MIGQLGGDGAGGERDLGPSLARYGKCGALRSIHGHLEQCDVRLTGVAVRYFTFHGGEQP